MRSKVKVESVMATGRRLGVRPCATRVSRINLQRAALLGPPWGEVKVLQVPVRCATALLQIERTNELRELVKSDGHRRRVLREVEVGAAADTG